MAVFAEDVLVESIGRVVSQPSSSLPTEVRSRYGVEQQDGREAMDRFVSIHSDDDALDPVGKRCR